MSEPPIGKIIIGILVAMAVVLTIGLLQGSQGSTPSLPALSPKTTPAPAPPTTPIATPAPTQPAAEIKPVLIKDWNGSGNMTTEEFTITDELWLISWANNPELVEEKSNGYLQIIVYNVENPDSPVAVIVNTIDPAASTGPVDMKGTFSLQIYAANTQWIAQVWVYKEE